MAKKTTGFRSVIKKNASNSRTVVTLVLAVILVGVIIYACVSISNISVQLNSKKTELANIQNQIEIQEIKNSEMEKLYNYSGDELSDYIEQLARDELDYIKQGERVFVNVSGD